MQNIQCDDQTLLQDDLSTSSREDTIGLWEGTLVFRVDRAKLASGWPRAQPCDHCEPRALTPEDKGQQQPLQGCWWRGGLDITAERLAQGSPPGHWQHRPLLSLGARALGFGAKLHL